MTRAIPTSLVARPLRWLRRGLVAFARDSGGVVAVEFAFVALPFLFLLASIIVIGFLLFCASTLDFATQKAARQIMVGTVQSANLTAQQFRDTVVCKYLPSPMFDCTKVVVNLTTVTAMPTAFDGFVKPDKSGLVIPTLDNTKTSFCPGSGGGAQVLRVLYPMPIYLALMSNAPQVVKQGDDSVFVLMSTAAFKNEPFQGAASTVPGC